MSEGAGKGKGDGMRKILVYNNQTGIVEKMEPLFAGEGMEMVVAAEAEEIGRFFEDRDIQLMLVDVALNDKGWDKGIELIAALRHASTIPLIVVSKQSAETAKIMALEAGADDYVTADCNPLELLARVKSPLYPACQCLQKHRQNLPDRRAGDRRYPAHGDGGRKGSAADTD